VLKFAPEMLSFFFYLSLFLKLHNSRIRLVFHRQLIYLDNMDITDNVEEART
jgi:hypothetical protein